MILVIMVTSWLHVGLGCYKYYFTAILFLSSYHLSSMQNRISYNYSLKCVSYRDITMWSALLLMILKTMNFSADPWKYFISLNEAQQFDLLQIINTAAVVLNPVEGRNALRVLQTGGCHPGGRIQFRFLLKGKRCIYCRSLLQSELKILMHSRLNENFIFKNLIPSFY